MGASILAVWQNAAFLLVNPINSPIHLCHVLLIFFAHWSIFDIEGVHSGHRRQSSSAFSWFYFYAPIISNLLYGHSNASRVQPSHLTDHPQPYKHPAHHLSSLIFSRVRAEHTTSPPCANRFQFRVTLMYTSQTPGEEETFNLPVALNCCRDRWKRLFGIPS